MKEGLKRAMLLEDDEDVRKYLRNVLEQLNYEVMVHATLAEFRKSLASLTHRPDLIVSDLNLQGEGESLPLLVEARSLYPYAPIILVTGDAQHVVRLRADACGLDLVLAKPVTMRELRSGIELACDKRSAAVPRHPQQNSQMTTS